MTTARSAALLQRRVTAYKVPVRSAQDARHSRRSQDQPLDTDKALCVPLGLRGCESWAVFEAMFPYLIFCLVQGTLLIGWRAAFPESLNWEDWQSLQMPGDSSVITVIGQGDPGLRLQLQPQRLVQLLFLNIPIQNVSLPVKAFYQYIGKQNPHCLNELPMSKSFGRLIHWSLVRVQQGAGVWADVVVFVDGLVQVQRLSVNTDLHTAAVGRRHQSGHQRNIWGSKRKHVIQQITRYGRVGAQTGANSLCVESVTQQTLFLFIK